MITGEKYITLAVEGDRQRDWHRKTWKEVVNKEVND